MIFGKNHFFDVSSTTLLAFGSALAAEKVGCRSESHDIISGTSFASLCT